MPPSAGVPFSFYRAPPSRELFGRMPKRAVLVRVGEGGRRSGVVFGAGHSGTPGSPLQRPTSHTCAVSNAERQATCGSVHPPRRMPTAGAPAAADRARRDRFDRVMRGWGFVTLTSTISRQIGMTLQSSRTSGGERSARYWSTAALSRVARCARIDNCGRTVKGLFLRWARHREASHLRYDLQEERRCVK
jgi:hypothetical protein